MNQIVFYAIVALVVFIGLAFTGYLLPLFRDKMNTMGLTYIVEWVDKAVRYAEQIYRGKGRGAEKHEEVFKIITEIVKSCNLKLTDEQIKLLIEASVFAMNNKEKDETNGHE